MNATAGMDEIFRIINADHHDPFSILGMHFAYLENKNEIISITDTVAKECSTVDERKAIEGKAIAGKAVSGKAIVIRAFIPNTNKALVINLEDEIQYEMEKIREEGFFELLIPGKENFFKYNIEITDYYGNCYRIYDPYCFPPVLTDFDLYLFNEGNHHKTYEKLGAHIHTLRGVSGTLFAVWAPCAKRVSVVGNFNQWDGRRHQMRSRGQSGIWEIFIPGIGEGEIYKYEIKTQNNELYLKADPYAFYSELRPGTASVVCNIDGYKWNDEVWMNQRDSSSFFDKPVAIYEVHLGSWARVTGKGKEEEEGKEREEGKEGEEEREVRDGEEGYQQLQQTGY